MLELITNISRLVFITLIFLITIISCLCFGEKGGRLERISVKFQGLCIYLIHLIGYVIIAFHEWTTEMNMELTIEMVAMYFLELFFIFIYRYAFHVLYKNSSKIFLNHITFFMIMGFIIVTRLNIDKGQKQFFFVFAGGILSLIIPFFMKKIKGLRNLSLLYGTVGIVGLMLVAIMGNSEYGANISLTIMGIKLQPQEFIKIIYVFFLASMLRKNTSLAKIFTTSVFAAIYIVILVYSKDLGSALIYFVTYIIMLYSATKKSIYAAGGIAGGLASSYVAYNFFDHVRMRVMVWRNPLKYANNEGYQIVQSLLSIGMGGFVGMGMYNGNPGKIPFVEKDFIFSAITEEFGIIFSSLLVIICMMSILLMLKSGMKLNESFYRLISVGFASVYGIQAFLTVAGGLNMIPITGVTLPLISYGGSSAVSTLLMFAVVLGLNMIDEDKMNNEDKEKPTRKRKQKQ